MQADDLLDTQPQAVIELLQPQINQFTSQTDLEDAYAYLGRAELKLKDYRAAAEDFKQLNALEPSVEYLYMLAVAYDLAGDSSAAIENYRALDAAEGTDAPVYRAMAERRIQELTAATPTPLAGK